MLKLLKSVKNQSAMAVMAARLSKSAKTERLIERHVSVGFSRGFSTKSSLDEMNEKDAKVIKESLGFLTKDPENVKPLSFQEKHGIVDKVKIVDGVEYIPLKEMEKMRLSMVGEIAILRAQKAGMEALAEEFMKACQNLENTPQGLISRAQRKKENDDSFDAGHMHGVYTTIKTVSIVGVVTLVVRFTLL